VNRNAGERLLIVYVGSFRSQGKYPGQQLHGRGAGPHLTSSGHRCEQSRGAVPEERPAPPPTPWSPHGLDPKLLSESKEPAHGTGWAFKVL